MKQKKLVKTIETIASKRFDSIENMLAEVLTQVVENQNIRVTGGRVWKLDPSKKIYKLVFQTGNVQKIKSDFELQLNNYDIFKQITNERTILSDETNQELRDKGIFRYSASGVGAKINVDGQKYYQYLLAVNSDQIDDNLRYSLNIIATVLTSKIKEWQLSDERRNLIKDIDKAREIQKSILPDHKLIFYNYEIFGATIPAQIIGGDFYDYVQIGRDEERLGIVLGDAASKGLSAAAEAMYISGAVRMAATFQLKISPMMNRINKLVNKIFSDDKFTTLFYGEISNDTRGLFLYANAGHNPPVFVDYESKQLIYLQPTGPLLGPAPNSKYETDSLNFNLNDSLVIYSDGIVEAANSNFEFYGEKRLEKIILANHDKSPEEIVYTILDDVVKFSTDDSKYQDDKTIVVLKRVK